MRSAKLVLSWKPAVISMELRLRVPCAEATENVNHDEANKGVGDTFCWSSLETLCGRGIAAGFLDGTWVRTSGWFWDQMTESAFLCTSGASLASIMSWCRRYAPGTVAW